MNNKIKLILLNLNKINKIINKTKIIFSIKINNKIILGLVKMKYKIIFIIIKINKQMINNFSSNKMNKIFNN